MNRIISAVMIFAGGFALGAAAAYTYLQKDSIKRVNEQVESNRKHYLEREAELDKDISEKAEKKALELLTTKYNTESDPEYNPRREGIELIEPDEFGCEDGYETSFLTYYADGKLVFDGEDEPVNQNDIYKIVGPEALKNFGKWMPSAIHVRNHDYHKDYEILRVRQPWESFNTEEDDE